MKYIGKQTRRAPHALIFCRFISKNKCIKQKKKKNNDMAVLVLKISLFVIQCRAISQDMMYNCKITVSLFCFSTSEPSWWCKLFRHYHDNISTGIPWFTFHGQSWQTDKGFRQHKFKFKSPWPSGDVWMQCTIKAKVSSVSSNSNNTSESSSL